MELHDYSFVFPPAKIRIKHYRLYHYEKNNILPIATVGVDFLQHHETGATSHL